jgi:type VI secretion system secreted protein VgrG
MSSTALPGMNALAATAAGALGDALASRLDFLDVLDQRGRMLRIDTALPSLALVPERMVVRETVSQPFELEVDCVSTSAHFELKRLIGEQISVRLLQADGSLRPWHGYVFEAAQLGSDGGLARYRLMMRPWLAMLDLRRDSFIFQDRDALQVVEEIFADYPHANFRCEVSERLPVRALCTQYRETDLAFVARLLSEEGLSYHFEHLDGEAAQAADEQGHARHVIVITDRHAPSPHLGDARFAGQHPSANLPGQKDAVTAFAAVRRVQPQAITLGAWDERRVAGVSATLQSALDLGELPTLEVYDGSGERHHLDTAHAERTAALALAEKELQVKTFEGEASTRHFEAGRVFRLIDHPLYGANTSAFNYAGALTASHARGDHEFILLAVEHHATNNLGAQAARLLGLTELEAGTYRNHFRAVPAVASLVPARMTRPTPPGLQTALVVGLPNETVTTDRDQRVKVQFPWQRGERPVPSGLPHTSSVDTRGNAPGDIRSGIWLRVAMPAAGANWGTVFTPRIGTEVAVQFIEGDIDRPVIVGQLHNSEDLPPFAAGEDSGVNHAGVVSGTHTRTLDGAGFNQWVVDDATGQLRMRLLSSYTAAEVGLGHLIQQRAESAQRGPWRGTGFELATQAWASVRAASGLLVSTEHRAATYGSAEGGQMDAQGAVSLLQGARNLGQRLGHAALAAGAHALDTCRNGKSVDQLIAQADPAQQGHHALADGQTAPAFAEPLVVLHTPSTAAFATEAGVAGYSGQHLSVVSQGDMQHAATHTHATVAGRTASLYTHAGGITAHAAHGDVSLRANADEMQILADREVQVVSVNDVIRIQAAQRIEIVGGQSSLVLEGGNITFTCPGTFAVHGSGHAFMGGASAPAELPVLAQGASALPT